MLRGRPLPFPALRDREQNLKDVSRLGIEHDYMDPEASVYALKKAKECGLSEEALRKTFIAVVKHLDEISRKHGRAAICEFVDSVEQRVLRAARN